MKAPSDISLGGWQWSETEVVESLRVLLSFITRTRSVEIHQVVTVRTEIRAGKLFPHHSQISGSKDEQSFMLPHFTFKNQ